MYFYLSALILGNKGTLTKFVIKPERTLENFEQFSHFTDGEELGESRSPDSRHFSLSHFATPIFKKCGDIYKYIVWACESHFFWYNLNVPLYTAEILQSHISPVGAEFGI